MSNANNQAEELISKSLDDIDTLLANIKGGSDITKGGADNLSPDEVSQDAPEDDDQQNDDQDQDTGADNGDGDDDADDSSDMDNDGEANDDADYDGEDEDTEKSMADQLAGGSDNVRKALEVSEFLRDLVKGISGVIDSQRGELSKSLESAQSTQMLLAKSFEGIAKSQRVVLETQAELLKSVKALTKRMKAIEEQPVVRKSVPSANTKPISKSFAGAPADDNQLNKSQAVALLSKAIDGGKRDLIPDLLALEGTGDFRTLSAMGRAELGLK